MSNKTQDLVAKILSQQTGIPPQEILSNVDPLLKVRMYLQDLSNKIERHEQGFPHNMEPEKNENPQVYERRVNEAQQRWWGRRNTLLELQRECLDSFPELIGMVYPIQQ